MIFFFCSVDLVQFGKYYESFLLSFLEFIPITEQYRPFGYKLRYPLFIAGDGQAKILLSEFNRLNDNDDVYEITIDTTWAKISKGDEVLRVTESGTLLPFTPVKVIIDVTDEGIVNVFTSHNPWVPLMSYAFKTKFDVKYISFASKGRVQFFHDVDEQSIFGLPIVQELTTDLETIDYVWHSFFEKLDYPIGFADLFFKKFYNVFVSTPTPIAINYSKFVPLNDFGVLPSDSYTSIPFYIRGNGEAHVVFSSTVNPTPYDDAYELCKFCFFFFVALISLALTDYSFFFPQILYFAVIDNRYVSLRKRIDGSIVVKTYWPNILSSGRRTKFVFEASVDGYVKVYSDFSPYKPLLSFFDPKPVKIEFIAFKSVSTENIEFFWGKNPSTPLENIVTELINSNYGQKPVLPEFVNWNKLVPVLNVKSKFRRLLRLINFFHVFLLILFCFVFFALFPNRSYREQLILFGNVA